MTVLGIARAKRAEVNGKLAPTVEAAKEAAAIRAAAAKEAAALRAAAAKEAAALRAAAAKEAAKEWAAPRVEAAVERTRDLTRDDIAPKVAAALAAATAASEPVLEEAKHRGELALAALRGQEVVVKKRRRWPKRLLLFAVIGAAAAAILSALQRKRFDDLDFSSADAAPAAADLGAVPTASDTAGASPDEAVADAVDEQLDREQAPETPVAPVVGQDNKH